MVDGWLLTEKTFCRERDEEAVPENPLSRRPKWVLALENPLSWCQTEPG
jgi:hypothetical protein